MIQKPSMRTKRMKMRITMMTMGMKRWGKMAKMKEMAKAKRAGRTKKKSGKLIDLVTEELLRPRKLSKC